MEKATPHFRTNYSAKKPYKFFRGQVLNPKTNTWEDFESTLVYVVQQAQADAIDRARDWAETVYKKIKKKTPVDTGNLQDSIEISDHLDSDGYIIVGVNEQKLIGPKYLRSKKSFVRDDPRLSLYERFIDKDYTPKGRVRYIPPYNYVPMAEKRTQDDNLRFFVTRVWFAIAQHELRQRFKT